ncbi:L-type lectin-domain containing receptor kinase IX.1-like [Juglans regia]|uniref:non-specific serine/threonine protein kinase n=2 Tax=Juglans regia TaxID=51240 RepID=A0A2I4DQX0_JUGRE|nr:L-type lectin-domain containing receptor kinase IX.1-like [Juglans regia]
MIFFLLLLPCANSVFFNLTSFQSNMDNMITFEKDAFMARGVLEVTKNQLDDSLNGSVGRASYAEPVRLWDAKTGELTDFITHFSFVIDALNKSMYGAGLSFFIAPLESRIPSNSSGGLLGLFSPESVSKPSLNKIVAVEFDSFRDSWDPSDDHVGININSIISKTTVSWSSSIKNGSTANAWVSYNSTTQNLSVFLTYADNPIFGGNSSLSYVVDLRTILPEWVRVGFSAATGDQFVEIHQVRSWSFNSSLKADNGNRKNRVALAIGLALGLGVLGFGLGLLWFFYWRKRVNDQRKKHLSGDVCMDDEFEKGTGPRRFTYRELSRATNNFAEEGKLGEGGFGGVYKGLLSESNTEIAVKRVSKGSKQGKKEYISEVRIISRLRHRNLVQLIGWCHEQGEFLLVYEYMPNGSLDSHLFRGKIMLTWPVRHKIALGLASSLLYLHEEWEQCVVHRDIKSSNIMLDANFNAKLGDFGLARLVDHELGSQTTVLAGTMGYLAPECVTTGKASKESDVYSFGVVALEIACGRKPVEPMAEPTKVRLVEWVWDLYGKGQILEAVDKGLCAEFDEQQIECLMVVGLWCCHPDSTIRPSIKQVINVLNFEAPLPSLPSKLPVPMYFAPPMDMCRFSYTSSGLTGSVTDQTRGSSSSGSTYSSTASAGSAKALLNSGKIYR